MKKISFKIKELPIVEYDRASLSSDLRDKLAQYLVKYVYKKVEAGDIENDAKIEYISSVFINALKLKISQRELENIESMRTKFPFLQYHQTTTDNMIHYVTYRFIALCNGDKKTIQSFISSTISDSKGNILSLREGLDWEYSKSLCNDVANLTRESVKEFLQELHETGSIMTSDELMVHRQSLAISDTTEEDESYSDDDFETDDTDNIDDTTTADTASNQNIQQRSASLSIVTDEENNKNQCAVETQAEDNSKPNALLDHLLSWIYELPEWLQEQIFNSTPMKALIESAEQWEKIYDRKTAVDLFVKPSPVTVGNSAYSTEDNINTKVTVADTSFAESIDMTMVLNEPTINGCILPMVAIGSDNLFGDADFNGLVNFNVF